MIKHVVRLHLAGVVFASLLLSACSTLPSESAAPPPAQTSTPVPATGGEAAATSTRLLRLPVPGATDMPAQAVTGTAASGGYRRFLDAAQANPGAVQIRRADASGRFANLRMHQATDTVRTAQTGNLEVHFMDVGQGDSTLVLCPNGKTLLIDAGNIGNKEQVGIELRDYLLEQLPHTQARIDTVVVTHPDRDHFNLLSEVLDGLEIGRIFHVGLYETDYGTRQGNTATFDDWLAGFPTSKVKVLQETYFDKADHPNRQIDCGQATVHILAANTHGGPSEKNARSIVLRLSYQDVDFILTGDATFETEEVILSRYPASWLQAEILKLGHHGSLETSSSQEWIDAIAPQIAIASAGWLRRPPGFE